MKFRATAKGLNETLELVNISVNESTVCNVRVCQLNLAAGLAMQQDKGRENRSQTII